VRESCLELLGERDEVGEVGVGELGEGGLAGGDDLAGEGALGTEQAGDLVLDGALGGEPVDLDGAVLADAVGAAADSPTPS
jgi:hypothetical protein